MRQFVLAGPQGALPVPAGESTLGSDAACQLCVPGEGVLPVHAYLSADDEKLLIRPASLSSSTNGSTVGSVAVNGTPLTGPATLSGGEDLVIGAVRMRLQVGMPARPSLWRRLWAYRACRITAWTAATLLLLLALGAAVVRWVILDQSRLKARLDRYVAETLLREDTDVESIQVRPLDGFITLKNVKIKERDAFAAGERPFFVAPSVTVSVDVWPWLRSWGREYRNLRVAVANPELNIERARDDGKLNIGDILGRYGGPFATDLGLRQLDATLEITGGKVRFNDLFTNIGETSLEELTLRLRQPGLGQPLVIEACQATANSIPAPAAKGVLKLSGQISLIDAAGTLDTSAVRSDDLRLEFSEFDLARVFEHLGCAWQPHGMDFKVVLGKPITGRLNVALRDAQNLWLSGAVGSPSLLSIREQGQPPLGNIPMALDFGLLFTNRGRGFLPNEIRLDLRSGAASPAGQTGAPATLHPSLLLHAETKLNPEGASEYAFTLDCSLEDLFATDVGRRLNLHGRLGGHVQGTLRLLCETTGHWKIDAKIESPDAFAILQPPPGSNARPVRQPLPLSLTSHASAQPSAGGGIAELAINSFRITAPSFQALSLVPADIKGLDQKGEMNAQARFKLGLKGREFYADFKPILDLFGFTQPIEEIFNLDLTVVGRNDFLQLAARGDASRQWHQDPSPVKLDAYVEFNRKAATPRKGKPSSPYLGLMLEVTSLPAAGAASGDAGRPMRVRLDAQCRRTETADVIALESFADKDTDRAHPLPGLVIESDITALRERFKPYIEGLLASQDVREKADTNGWLKLYRDSTLTGEVEQSGRVVLHRMLDPKAVEPDRLEFNLNVAGRNLALKMPQGLLPGGAPPGQQAPAGHWSWSEKAVTIETDGGYTQRLSESKEEPHKERLDLKQLNVKGSIGAFQLSLADLDVFKLFHLRSLPNQTWTDCVARLTMTGRLDPPASDLARTLRLLPADNPLSGTLALQAGFDRQKNTLDLRQFKFRQPRRDQPDLPPLVDLDVTGSVAGVRQLSTRLLQPADQTPFSARLATFVQDAGPAGLLDHFGNDLAIATLQVETGPVMAMICEDYKEREPPPLLAGLLREDWRPDGRWIAHGVRLARVGDPKDRKWTILAAKLRNDFTAFAPAPRSGAARPAAFSMAHEWGMRLGLSISGETSIGLAGDVDLDNAALAASLPMLRYEYKKPVGEKCRVEVGDCWYSHGRPVMAHVGRLAVQGKPVGLDLKDFDADYSRVPGGSFQLGELIVMGGPLPCAVAVQRYEPSADFLQARISAPAADLGYLAGVLELPRPFTAAGALKDVSVAYRGSVIGLQAALGAAPETLAARFRKLDADDPRLQGLDPARDTLEFDAATQDLRLTARAPAGETAEVRLAGQFRATARDVAWKNLAAEVACRTGAGVTKQAFTSSKLTVRSADAKLTPLRAALSAGGPLAVAGDFAFSTELDPVVWLDAQDALLAAAGKPQASGAVPGERRLTPLAGLTVTGTLKAPGIAAGSASLSAFEARDFALKNLKLSLPVLTTTFAAGRLELSDADLDLSKAALVKTGRGPELKGLAFRLRFKLTEADLVALLGGAPEAANAGYAIAGRVDAQGNLDGTDFAGMSRHTWDGAVKVRLSNLTVQPPRAAEPVSGLPLWCAGFAAFGKPFADAAAAAGAGASVSVAALGKDLPVARALIPANALALAAQVYLTRACGLDAAGIALEPLEPTLMVAKGFALLDRVKLAGRDQAQGLEAELRNMKLNLADGALTDEILLHPLALPQLAQAALKLERWPADVRAQFLRNMSEGKLALRLLGRLAAPDLKLPWAELRHFGRRALFGADHIADLAALEKARQHCLQTWGREPQDIAAAAAVADRLGVGLPATWAARAEKETILDHVAGLPPSLAELLDKNAPVIAPADSLTRLLSPPPPVPPGPGVKPQPDGKGK